MIIYTSFPPKDDFVIEQICMYILTYILLSFHFSRVENMIALEDFLFPNTGGLVC